MTAGFHVDPDSNNAALGGTSRYVADTSRNGTFSPELAEHLIEGP